MAKHPLFATKDVWANVLSGMATRTSDKGIFETLLSRQINQDSITCTMNAYVALAVDAMAINGGRRYTGKPVFENASLAYGPANSDEYIDLVAEMDDPLGGCVICELTVPLATGVRLDYNAVGSEAHISATKVSANGTASALPSIPVTAGATAPFNLLPMYLIMVQLLRMVDRETANIVAELHAGSNNDGRALDDDDIEKRFFQLSHLVYSVFGAGKSNGLKIAMTAGNIPKLRTKPVVTADDIIFGEAKELLGGNTASAARYTQPKTFGEAKPLFAKYAASQKWSQEEEDLIPTFPDDYPMMPETLKIARRFVNSRNNKRPMNNFLWRGITSYGKSTGVEMVAALLHTPLVRMTCSTTTETQDFLSKFVPCNDADLPQGDIPDIEQMMYDPEGSWLAITGNEKEDATPQECMDELLRRVAATKGDAAKFKHIESNYVKALAHGWICEIQEFSRIRDPGVLVGLNEYDRPNAIVPLVDGGYVRRSHDAMVIYTDNVGLASCRPVDASVIRRMAFALDSDKMPKQMVLDRVKYNTGFDDDKLLDTMYLVWKKIQEYCKTHDITEGPVSVTELEMWVQTVCIDTADDPSIEGDKAAMAYETVLECVVGKATSVINEQEEIMTACVESSLFGSVV